MIAAALVHNPGQLAALCAALCQCFAFERSGAGLLLFAVPEGGAYEPRPRPLAALPASPSPSEPDPDAAPGAKASKAGGLWVPEPLPSGTAALHEVQTPGGGSGCDGGQTGDPGESTPEPRLNRGMAGASGAAAGAAPGQAGRATEPSGSLEPSETLAPAPEGAPAVLLPRMPVGLALAADQRTYQALAGVARGAGRMAAAAGAVPSRGSNFRADLNSMAFSRFLYDPQVPIGAADGIVRRWPLPVLCLPNVRMQIHNAMCRLSLFYLLTLLWTVCYFSQFAYYRIVGQGILLHA